MKPFVSVIVPTYKRQDLLLRCLESLAKQDYPKDSFEVIIIHDGLDCLYDKTTLKKKRSLLKNSNFYCISHRGVASVRNYGISKAKGDLILTIDDDCEAETDWISSFVNFMNENKQVISSGGTVKPSTPTTFIQKYISFKRLLYQPVRDTDGKIITLITANACFREGALKKVGGFREKILYAGGEDVDLSMRLREVGVLAYSNKSVVYHFHRTSLENLIKQHIAYGRGTFLACSLNNIKYEKLKFYKPNIIGLLRYILYIFTRIFTVSIPEFWNKKLPIAYWLPYVLLDIIRKFSFMIGATLEYYKH